jgi:hypothetical protein
MGEPATSHSSNGRPVDNRRAGELKRKIWAVDHLMPGAGAVQVFNEVFDVGRWFVLNVGHDGCPTENRRALR